MTCVLNTTRIYREDGAAAGPKGAKGGGALGAAGRGRPGGLAGVAGGGSRTQRALSRCKLPYALPPAAAAPAPTGQGKQRELAHRQRLHADMIAERDAFMVRATKCYTHT